MKNLWKFYYDDEFLTVKEQSIKEKQQNMSIGFWIGFITMALLFNLLMFI